MLPIDVEAVFLLSAALGLGPAPKYRALSLLPERGDAGHGLAGARLAGGGALDEGSARALVLPAGCVVAAMAAEALATAPPDHTGAGGVGPTRGAALEAAAARVSAALAAGVCGRLDPAATGPGGLLSRGQLLAAAATLEGAGAGAGRTLLWEHVAALRARLVSSPVGCRYAGALPLEVAWQVLDLLVGDPAYRGSSLRGGPLLAAALLAAVFALAARPAPTGAAAAGAAGEEAAAEEGTYLPASAPAPGCAHRVSAAFPFLPVLADAAGLPGEVVRAAAEGVLAAVLGGVEGAGAEAPPQSNPLRR
ncbi:hypothetical protein HYH03_011279 [Edaphochlamys debaryana]|uniref:Uncharacterized protein n=1 Tax=Edaphochlamys debaryana TaxID=47281 RepID=A0A836BVD4_9CHLO|nr:hypothetical protein HYH03_011279 [Edaphochlamys debaryana]|eukprot:KAG2490330.1 hypothetical protein HYH03_011279 [Edaphochlamys debaryana]